MPTSAPGVIPRPGRCVEVYGYSILWPDLIPQHGRGPKRARPIVLEEWQRRLIQNRKNISVARRDSVATLNEFLGPKR